MVKAASPEAAAHAEAIRGPAAVERRPRVLAEVCCTADCAHQQDRALSLHRALQQNEDIPRVPSGGGGLIHLFVVRDSRRLQGPTPSR